MTDLKKTNPERLAETEYLRNRIAELENRSSTQSRIEQRLRESEAKYRVLIETLNEGIWTINAEGYTTFVNPKMAEMLGYSIEEMDGQHLFAFVDDEELTKAKEKLKSREQGKSEQHEFKFRKKNGEPLYVLLNTSPIFDDQGHYSGALASLSDITERMRMEQSLKEREENFRNFLDYASDLIQEVGPQGGILYVNRAWCKKLGYTKEEALQLSIRDILHPRSLPDIMNLLASLMQGGTIQKFETVFICKDGGEIWVEGNGSGYFKDGKFVATRGFFRDITDRKKAEDKTHVLLKEKEILLREVHHRIKNNMTAVESLINLQASRALHMETISVLRDVKSRLQSMRVMYDKLYLSNNFTDVSVKGYLSTLVDEVVRMFPETLSVEIVKEIEDFSITAEKTFSLGILINELITNSMKYAFTAEKKNILRVTAALQNKRAMISIQDNGPGIPESIDLEHSEGFGLQLVSLLTQQIGGTIRIEREKGTTFILEFEV